MSPFQESKKIKNDSQFPAKNNTCATEYTLEVIVVDAYLVVVNVLLFIHHVEK